ncbi:MAG TPA: MBL fold metallo-hydrolase [Steroidobacteraceae bacterium]|jgi:glyoxylase-like metal-dependent hydrolase (beta-lactamase superfamily II)|nr:MBL fold metallo-hydrolase [Steroidobacteraceae bacterium]
MQPVTLGRMTVQKVFEMESGPPLPLIVQGITPEDLAKLATWYADESLGATPEQSAFMMSMHSYVLQLDGLTVLVDACNGNHKQRSIPDVNQAQTPFLANLAKLGLTTDDIDLVLCTHLHFDHVGWNTRLENGKWVPTFANARYLFSRRDFEHFGSQELEDDHVRAFRDSVLPVYEAGRAQLIEADMLVHRQIGDGVWLEPAFGHSPGNFAVLAECGGERAIFWGDVVHHPVQLVRPDLPMSFDADPDMARATRRRIIDRAVDETLVCFPAHFRDPSAGRVVRDGNVYRYRFLAQR